ncbi:MAG: PAS domain-containing protein [Dongiaceae bacterium]
MMTAVQDIQGGSGGPFVAGGDDDDTEDDTAEAGSGESDPVRETDRTPPSPTDIPWAIAKLHVHWFQLGGGQPVERRLIEPAALKALLPFLQLIEFETAAPDAPPRLRYRLTGTHIDHIHGRNLTGRYLDELAPDDGSGVLPFLQHGYISCYSTGQAFIGRHEWTAPPRNGLPVDPESPRRLRLWLGAFPLLIDGRIAQCLSIESYEGLNSDSKVVPWLRPGDVFSGD